MTNAMRQGRIGNCGYNRALVCPLAAYVKSQTLSGDGLHTQGVVLGEIVKANIPVRNGVVHLIHRPLVIVDTTVVQFLEVSDCSLLTWT